MRSLYNEKALIKNPCVLKVDRWRLTLRTDFKIELFELWRNGEMDKIEQRLTENGLVPGVVDSDFGKTLITSFKNSGYPAYKSEELVFSPGKQLKHPLIKSGKFEVAENSHHIKIRKDFENELFAKYPEISIEESLRSAGIDPADVGYQRIFRLEKLFEKRAQQIYSANTVAASEADKDVGDYRVFRTDEKEMKKLFRHPYIQDYDGIAITLSERFYNEAYLIADAGVDTLLKTYELPLEMFNSKDRLCISTKLYNWSPTEKSMDELNSQVLRIWRARIRIFTTQISGGFEALREELPCMDNEKKRHLACWINSLPRDPWKYYTTRRILEIVGLAKSTYYELLRNEDYGNGAKRRAMRDDEDILLVQQVAEYKGYKKGYRQISMMMEDVTGKNMSPHRVLYLMHKYGMRTSIRKPSKNRKAMKELMKRNGKPNLLMRRFKLHRPNEVRLTDVTYLDYGTDQRAYGSASIDPVTGKLICFIISENNDLKLALDTLKTMDEYPLKSGGIIHSDQGILYFTDDFQAAVAERDLIQSMSRRGNCWDNAPQESFFGHFKDECDYKKCRTLNELQIQIDDYRVYYNEKRRIWERKKMTPSEYEAYLESLDEKAFREYMKKEEAVFLRKKEKSAQAAVDKAKRRKKAIKDRLEEIENETGSKAEI
nr:IS3 family transposase [Clostridia bacterium]